MKTNMVELEEKFNKESLNDERVLNKIIDLTKVLNIKSNEVEISDIEKLNLDENLESLLIYYLGTIGVDVKYGVYSEINEEGLSYDDSVRLFIKDISMYKLLTPEEELNFANKYFYDKDELAKEALINHNLRLVLATANRFVGHGLELADLIQEGSRGLMRSIEKFDPSKGFKLSTYAMWWIRQYIKRGIHDQARIVRIPVHMNEKIEKMRSIMKEYVIKNEEEASDEYLKKELGVSGEIFGKLKLFLNDVDSLDAPVKNDEDRNDSFLVDFIEDETQSVQEIAEEHLLSDSIEEAMDNSSLPERTKDIIRMRFGLKPYKRIHTLEETGKVYGITRERTRQIEVKALRRLRNNRTLKELSSR